MMPLALTCGDPSGIGPEICVAAWHALKHNVPMVYFGAQSHLPPDLPRAAWTPGSPITDTALSVVDIGFPGPPTPGMPNLGQAAGTIEAIERATAMAMAGDVAGVVTAPIQKQVLQDGAGFGFPGHTEFLAHLAGVDHVVMMLACSELRVVPLTIHIPLRDVAPAITPKLITETVKIIDHDLRTKCGIQTPRIKVAGLNPHASEGGKIGEEDITLIAPVVQNLQQQGFEISGPVSADTMFHPAARSAYDVALCMYHDQALIPIKTLDFSGGVNVTLGLPFVRTSPDHGTAYDIAGKGKADPSSMIAAVNMAWDMAHAN